MDAQSSPKNNPVKSCPRCKQEYDPQLVVCPEDGTMLMALKPDPLIGSTISDRYEVLSSIGEGGMSVVYRARHQHMGRLVAIKMLKPQLISEPVSLKRFQQEAKTISSLKHPNIIAVFDYGTSPQPYLVMDYLEGISLADLLKDQDRISVEIAIKIFGQVCDALMHAHEKGVVHRDLKPGNIMLTGSGDGNTVVQIVDFGIAKLMPWAGEEMQRLTATGEVFGSPIYMSPEQCLGKQLDHRTDVYSMGIVMHEALAGKPPIKGLHAMETMHKHLKEPPISLAASRPDLSFPEGLQAILNRAMEKDPALRYQTMQELKQDLLALSSAPSPTRPAPELDKAPSPANQPAVPEDKTAKSTGVVRVKLVVILLVVLVAVGVLLALTLAPGR